MGGPPRHTGRASGDGGRHPRVDGRRRRRALPGAGLPAERQRQLRGAGAPVPRHRRARRHLRSASALRPPGPPGRVAGDHRAGQGVRLSRARQPRARGPGVGRGPGAGGPRGSGPVVRVVPLSCRHDPPGDGAAHSPAPRRLAGHGRAVAPARHTQPGDSMAGQVSGTRRSVRRLHPLRPPCGPAHGRPRRGGRQAGRRVRLRPRHGGGGRGHAGVPLADTGGGARTGDRRDRRAPAHDGRQRRRLRRPAPAPAQLRLLRPGAGRLRPRPRAAEPAGGDLQDGRLPGRALPRPRPWRDPSGRGGRPGRVRR